MSVLEDDGSEKVGARTGEAILREDQAELTEGVMFQLKRMLE